MLNRLSDFIYKHPKLMKLLGIHTPSGHFYCQCWCQDEYCYWGEPSTKACWVVDACGCKVVRGGRASYHRTNR